MAELSEVADYYFEVCELYEDENLDPEDHATVIERAFMSSDCDDFAWIMNEITGYQVVRVSWQIPDWGYGHHSVVRDNSGDLIDVRGVTNLESIRKHFGIKPSVQLNVRDVDPTVPSTFDMEPDDHGFQMLIAAVRSLPHPPFNSTDFTSKLDQLVERLHVDDLTP